MADEPKDEVIELIQDSRSIFVPLMKVDLEKREVYGFATVEEPDTANEVMDYASSKPYFLAWSQETKKRSQGKSLGNLRAMHGPIAAGKVIALTPNDTNKSIFIGAKVVNDSEWEMVKEGVYTGFSVGGRYVKRWYGDDGFMHYTAQPMEISLVDSPAVRSATFQMVKADGAVVEVPFKKVDAPAPQTLTADDQKVNKSPDTFSPVTININMVPPSGALMSATNPNAQVLTMDIANASPATDQGPGASGTHEAAYKAEELQMTADELKTLIDQRVEELLKIKANVNDPVEPLMNSNGLVTAPDNNEAVVAAVQAAGLPMQMAPEHAETGMNGNVDPAASQHGVGMVQKAAEETKPEADASEAPSEADEKTKPPTKAEKKEETPDEPGDKESPTDAPEKAAEPEVNKINEGTMTQEQKEPMATVPTSPVVIGAGLSVVEQHLPSFMKALEGGSMRAAQKVVRDINGGEFDQSIFDEMFTKAQHKLLTEGGWTFQNLKTGRLNNHEQSMDPNELQKAIALADMPNIYLIRLMKLMLPLYAGLRRRIASNPPPVGADKAQWRAELGYSNFDFAAAMSVAEASVGGSVSESFLSFAAPFKRSSLNDAVTLEAIYATRGYDDPLQIAVIRALTLLLGTEERMILGANSGSIAAPGTVTAASAATGGFLAAGSYIAYVTALTYRGYLGTTKAGSPAGYGETTTGSNAQVVFGSGTTNSIALSWAAVKGAVAYNVYLAMNGTSRYAGTTTINTFTATSYPGAGTSYPAADTSANANGFEGIIPWCDLSTVYGAAIPNKTFVDQAGSGLTTYAGGISEFDTMLAALWTNWQIAPSLILTSPNGVKHLTKQLLSTSQVSAYRIEVGSERGQISGGAFVTGYTNKFAPFADGTPRVIDIMPHPYMPDGSYKFISESIPYPMARESRGWVLETLIPYTYFPLSQNDIRYPFSMLFSETLECFHPGAQASINGVDFTK